MRISLYYHLAAFPGWQQLTFHHIARAQYTGLWAAADRIHFQLHYEPHLFKEWLDSTPYLKDRRVSYTLFHEGLDYYRPSFRPLGETYSIIELHEQIEQLTEPRVVFRWSNKGCPHLTKDTRDTALKWNEYLEYWNLDRWQLHYQAVKQGYDTSGVNWHTPGDPTGHYSGTWWWATSEYLKRLPRLRLPYTAGDQCQLGGYSPRHDAEVWIGQGYPRYMEYHHYEHALVYHVEPPQPRDYRLPRDL